MECIAIGVGVAIFWAVWRVGSRVLKGWDDVDGD